MLLILFYGFTVSILFIRLWYVLPYRILVYFVGKEWIWKQNNRSTKPIHKIKTMIILGSGGHTTEMLKIIHGLKKEKYTPIGYVVATTDSTSRKLVEIQRSLGPEDTFFTIPRSREVGQSWSSTIFSFLLSCWSCITIFRKFQPDLILANGPGTCVPMCIIAFVLHFLGLTKKTKIIFCESYARVESLSLTGKILFYIADRFVVHWPQQMKRYPSVEYIGTIC